MNLFILTVCQPKLQMLPKAGLHLMPPQKKKKFQVWEAMCRRNGFKVHRSFKLPLSWNTSGSAYPPPTWVMGLNTRWCKRWNKARPHVVPLVGVARSERLRRERKELVDSRTSAVTEAASHVLRTAPPKTWAYVPPFYTIHTFAPLRTLIDDPSDARLTSQDARLADALVGLPAFVEAWRAEKRALLASLLPPAVDADVATPADVRRLELATSVFTCLGSWVGGMTVTAGRSLIGWEGAGAHLRCRSLARFWDHRPHYAPEGAAAARELVRLVGLDPETTTAAEMDRLCGDGREGNGEKRFFACCVRQRGTRMLMYDGQVQHTIKCTRIPGFVPHAAPAWALLTDAGVEDVRRREQPDPVQFDTTWMCIICTGHYEERVQLYDAIAHVRDVHGIRSPEEGLHYMHFPGAERTYTRVPVLLSQEGDVAEYRCNRCPQGKLRSLRGLGRHVTDKYTRCGGPEWGRLDTGGADIAHHARCSRVTGLGAEILLCNFTSLGGYLNLWRWLDLPENLETPYIKPQRGLLLNKVSIGTPTTTEIVITGHLVIGRTLGAVRPSYGTVAYRAFKITCRRLYGLVQASKV
ncbi:hypothetical protein DFH07DRAFT_785892 [Mycena maculata]|uniref:Uncharacterized protein n=1 Tax=Mycena maculata TaxID=230809 RepID=A0AAD7MEE3_9AGAR|nr:hypothetical protein DFH07DRAFT_785892 [Mycena maculata]